MEKKICKCNIPTNLQQEEMYKKIEEYILRIDPELCVDDKEYEKRLGICSSCEHLMGGLTCQYCGCFVLARAKKITQRCPKPRQDKWRE